MVRISMFGYKTITGMTREALPDATALTPIASSLKFFVEVGNGKNNMPWVLYLCDQAQSDPLY